MKRTLIGGNNKRLWLLAAILLFPLFVMAQNRKKVAVYVMGEDVGINKVLGSKLVSAIARSEDFSAIERTESFLAELSKEQSYQRTGAVDDSELSRLGKQFGVEYICVANVSDAFNEKYLSARLIDVETAQVERTASSSGAIQSLDGIVSAADSVSKDLLFSLRDDKKSGLKKVAVYVVRSEAGKNIGRVLGDKLVAGFTNSGRYIAIERSNSFLSQLSKEQNYQHSGAVDDNDLSRLGKQFGVQYVCVTDISDVFGEIYISARLVDVETAEVVNTYDIGGEMNNMSGCLQMANDIAANLSKGTFAEQAEEARIEAEKVAERQARFEKRRQELISMEEKGYIIVKIPDENLEDTTRLMVCLEPINISYDEYKGGRNYSKYGYSDWRCATTWECIQIRKCSVTSHCYDFVNGISDDAIYDPGYIVHEYWHYLGVIVPFMKTGYYWAPFSIQYEPLEILMDSYTVHYLDGTDNRILFVGFDDAIYNKKEFKNMKGKAILVRRM